MNSPKQNAAQAIHAAEGLYNRLILLVGDARTGKTSVLRELADERGTHTTNVNMAVSEALLELSPRQRALRVPQVLDEVLSDDTNLSCLDNLEILFDKDLKQDPLRLLLNLSRNHTIVASWCGGWANEKLTYAELGHPEYRSYESVGALIVTMDGRSTVASQ